VLLTSVQRVVEHNEGRSDRDPGGRVPLRVAQERLGAAGQMLALDPPGAPEATVAVFATGDSGPLRHRYGAARDLIVGITVALPDGSVAKAGGKVSRTSPATTCLGFSLAPSARWADRPIVGGCTAPTRGPDRAWDLRRRRAARRRRESAGPPAARGRVPRRRLVGRPRRGARCFGGATAQRGADHRRPRWSTAARPTSSRTMPPVAAPARAPAVDLRLRGQGPRPAGRPSRAVRATHGFEFTCAFAALGLWWITLPGGADAIERLREALAPAACVVTDAPEDVRAAVDPWHTDTAEPLGLLRRVKEQFDPAGVCNPGLYVGGI
jgi:glycolate oxidase FAD binding subunit